MKICALCRKEIGIDKYFSSLRLATERKAVCPECGGDLHICLNCRFYSESAHNKCIETRAEFQRTRDKTNFCDYFVFRESSHTTSADKEKKDAKKKFEELFKSNKEHP